MIYGDYIIGLMGLRIYHGYLGLINVKLAIYQLIFQN